MGGCLHHIIKQTIFGESSKNKAPANAPIEQNAFELKPA